MKGVARHREQLWWRKGSNDVRMNDRSQSAAKAVIEGSDVDI